MSVILGIHNGHHGSCAIVRDGQLIAAVEQERITGIKGDGADGLTNRLPVSACLIAAGVDIDDVDVIVSSFQSMSAGGVGLARPLFEPGFNLFDPYDRRHIVLSHHLAHALCAVGSAGYRDAAVVVSDLAGSTTRDGRDFSCSFADFQRDVGTMDSATSTLTECLSIYDIDENSTTLHHREFCVPHNTPEVFVCSAASLYDNVSRLVFDRDNAHGQLMALASMGEHKSCEVSVHDLIETREAYDTIFRNDWQPRVLRHDNQEAYAPLAAVVQMALEKAMLNAVRRARHFTRSVCFAGSGGTFLNINLNSHIARSGLFDRTFVPSSPHDAGIAVGCAFHGWRSLNHAGIALRPQLSPVTDRLGNLYTSADQLNAVSERKGLLQAPIKVVPTRVAELLRDGAIIGRFAGRAEFGPRALGGRSFLASPLISNSKDRLNQLKGRQSWRPVAPVIPIEALTKVFEGPPSSPYMSYVYAVRTEHRNKLPALSHPDGSARVQTLEQAEDAFLYSVLCEFGRLTGYPVLVNTSFNGPGDPIVEKPADVLEFLLCHEDLDAVLLEENLVCRNEHPTLEGRRLAEDVIVTWVGRRASRRVILVRGRLALEVSAELFGIMDTGIEESIEDLHEGSRKILTRAARLGFLVSQGTS